MSFRLPVLGVAAVILVGVAAMAYSSVGAASVTMTPCFGAPADYVAQYDGVRGQAVDGQVTYPYKTVYLEYQGWLTANTDANGDGVVDVPPGHHSEHIHEGACLPEGQVIDDSVEPWFLDAKYTFHNVVNYTLTSAAAQSITAGGSTNVFVANATQVAEMNAAMQQSGSLNTITQFESYQSSSTLNQGNGWKELRWNVVVDRANSSALVDEWKINGRSYYDQELAGKTAATPLGSPDCHIDFVRTQNWITYHDEANAVQTSYGYAGFGDSRMNLDGDCIHPARFSPDALATTRPDPWSTIARTTDGTNRLFVYIDPNFHVHPDSYAWSQDLGDPASSGTLIQGGYDNTISVPLGSLSLAGGVHRFMVQGHKWPGTPQIKPIGTSITVMPFLVAGDTTAPTAPTGVAISNPQPSSVTLSWNASTDDTAVAGYRVYLDGTQVADVTDTSATISGLSAPSHLLEVEAYDAAGNASARSGLTVSRSWVAG